MSSRSCSRNVGLHLVFEVRISPFPQTVWRPTPVQCAAKGVAETADRRVILDDEDLLERLDELRQPDRIDTVQPGHVHDLHARPQRLSCAQRLVQHHGTVGKDECI